MKSIQPYKSSLLLLLAVLMGSMAYASSHREAPLIADDPLADNVDVYAFRSPDAPDFITLIATYIPMQLPHGGPNWYHFGEDIRYEIHVDNDADVPGDEITYRFTFTRENEDPTTFFNIRLGKENLKTTYKLVKIDADGNETVMINSGTVPAHNIGPRSIESAVGLGQDSYASYSDGTRVRSADGTRIFAGPVDDPFFVDLGGIFDLGDSPRQGEDAENIDGLACFNTNAIVLQVPITVLRKEGAHDDPDNILDPNYVIGVWASASRPKMRTLQDDGSKPEVSDDWVQVSRLGMPLTNEAVIPIGMTKTTGTRLLLTTNWITDTRLDRLLLQPGTRSLHGRKEMVSLERAVPAFAPLRIQDGQPRPFSVMLTFSNGADGLFILKGNEALDGTALDDDVFGGLLLPGEGKPRSVDLWPIFHTGVPNVAPYQLATGKTPGNPLTAGKPFINNFLPNGGDMLRLNMAVPVTPRDSSDFNSLGLVHAAVLGLTDPRFNTNTDLQAIPNMDGFPNGRRLEDDVTRIELQAVAGIVLAAIGLGYDDFDPAAETPNLVTPMLGNVLGYTTGIEMNDKAFRDTFPYLALPHSAKGECSGAVRPNSNVNYFDQGSLGVDAPNVVGMNYPNPFQQQTSIRIRVRETAAVNIDLFDVNGRKLQQLTRQTYPSGEHDIPVQVAGLPQGIYFAVVSNGSGKLLQTIRMVKSN